jgi:hypothetical protein
MQRQKALYHWFDAEDKTRIFIGPSYHGFSQENREAMYQFFNETTGIHPDGREPELIIERDEILWATPKGQIHHDPQARSIFSFTKEKAEALTAARQPKNGEALQQTLKDLLKLPPDQPNSTPPDYRILRSMGNRGYPAKGYCTYLVETEPRVFASVTRLHDDTLTSRPPLTGKAALLYVAHQSADAELRQDSWLQDLIQQHPEHDIYVMDVRGCGESQPDICGKDQFHRPYGSDYFISAHSLMLGRPYLGQKTHDVLRVIDWLKAHGHPQIHLSGKGWGALPAAFAGLLHADVTQVSLADALRSYLDVAQTEDYRWPLSMLLPNVLLHTDLPEVYDALKAKKLILHSQLNGSAEPVE